MRERDPREAAQAVFRVTGKKDATTAEIKEHQENPAGAHPRAMAVTCILRSSLDERGETR
jgi:hypothetical protein